MNDRRINTLALMFSVAVPAAFWLGTTQTPEPQVIYETIVQTVEVEVEKPYEPLPRGEHRTDSEIDWDEVDRKTDCIWDILQTDEIDITLENVLTVGDWVDINPKACS